MTEHVQWALGSMIYIIGFGFTTNYVNKWYDKFVDIPAGFFWPIVLPVLLCWQIGVWLSNKVFR